MYSLGNLYYLLVTFVLSNCEPIECFEYSVYNISESHAINKNCTNFVQESCAGAIFLFKQNMGQSLV